MAEYSELASTGNPTGPNAALSLTVARQGLKSSPGTFRKICSGENPAEKGTSKRNEKDIPEIQSAVFNSRTTGAPILFRFPNEDVKSASYEKIKNLPRPGHADFTAYQKYGPYRDYRGGGHFSGRITTGIVAAGVIAKKLLNDINIRAELIEAGGTKDIDGAVAKAVKEKNSIGGIVECRAQNVPAGLGEPFFDSFESQLSHLIFSIPAIKGIEFGSGFKSAAMKGSENNDTIISPDGKTETNNAGGINGGISNGNEIIFKVAVKPTSSIALPQKTINLETGKKEELIVKGRHDTCIALRMPVIIEAALAIVLADFMMLEQRIGRVLG